MFTIYRHTQLHMQNCHVSLVNSVILKAACSLHGCHTDGKH